MKQISYNHLWKRYGGCYLAFLRDSVWIEVALLHPVLDGGGPGTNMNPMREAYGDNGNCNLTKIYI